MSLFSTDRERRLWAWTIAVVVAIFSTLGLAQTLVVALGDSGLGAGLFLLCCLLVLATVVTQGLTTRPSSAEITVALGVVAAYLLVFVRMTLPTERSHLIEYGVVAVFIYEALTERARHGRGVPLPALLAVVATSMVGVVDECIQWFLPSRMFEQTDILFNVLAAVMAVATSVALGWARRLASHDNGLVEHSGSSAVPTNYPSGVTQMTLFKALATIVGTSIGFGIAGTGIGALLGKFAPSFFQLFVLREMENFNALEIGIGLGLVNGMIWGLVIGVVVVGILSWKEKRTARMNQDGDQ